MRIKLLIVTLVLTSVAYAKDKCESVVADSDPKDVEAYLVQQFQSSKSLLEEIKAEYPRDENSESIWACNPDKLDECASEIKRKLARAKVFWVHFHSERYWFSVFEGGQERASHGYAFVFPTPEHRFCPNTVTDGKISTCEINLGEGWGLSRTWTKH